MPQGDIEDLQNRFGYHPATDENGHGAKHDDVRRWCFLLARDLHNLLPEGREKATTFTKLEEAMFWANAAIARN